MLIQPHQRRWIEKNLIDHDIPFVVFGGVAVKHYRPDRQTDDVDIFVGADDLTIERLVAGIIQLCDDPNARAKLRDPRVGHFKVGEPLKIDVLTFAPGLEILEAVRTAEVLDLDGVPIPILSLDLLIAHKRAVGEPKDLKDIELLVGSDSGALLERAPISRRRAIEGRSIQTGPRSCRCGSEARMAVTSLLAERRLSQFLGQNRTVGSRAPKRQPSAHGTPEFLSLRRRGPRHDLKDPIRQWPLQRLRVFPWHGQPALHLIGCS
jgi:hypothetical protein